jgi:feruloyl esterase
MEAQRYPDDFDGIIAGAPANHWEHLLASAIWIEQATHVTPASSLSNDKLAILHQAALEACDASDGVKDGVIRDTLSCHFDPAVTQCKGTDTAACLPPEQVDAARKIYAGPVNPRTHEKIFPGLEPGGRSRVRLRHACVSDWSLSLQTVVFKDPSGPQHPQLRHRHSHSREGRQRNSHRNQPQPQPFFAHTTQLISTGLSDGLIAP